jgi:hypothetical protein
MRFDPPRDALEFLVRFVCGAVFGTVLGAALCWRVLPEFAFSWFTVLGVMMFFGIFAALCGDRFWHFLLGLFRGW